MTNSIQNRERAELEQHPYPKKNYRAKTSAKIIVPVEGQTKPKISTISLGEINKTVERDIVLSVLEDILFLQKYPVKQLSYTDYDESTSPYFANLYREK